MDISNINPTEWEASKLAASMLTVLEIREEKGKEEGIEIGQEEGIEIGKEENKKDTAITAIKEGFSNTLANWSHGCPNKPIENRIKQ